MKVTSFPRVTHQLSLHHRGILQGASGPVFVCFYCRGRLQKGSGRRFRIVADGPIWEVHSKHRVATSEIPVTEEEEQKQKQK